MDSFGLLELWAVVLGLVSGGLVGATGVGGAAVAAPVLVLGLGVPAPIAIATDAVFVAVVKIVGVRAHRSALAGAKPLLLRVLVGAVPGAILGVFTLSFVAAQEGGNAVLERILGGLLVAAAVATLIRVWGGPPLVDETPGVAWWLTPVSFALGFLVGLTSIGAGSLFLPVLLYAAKGRPFREVVAVGLLQGLVLALVSGGLHLFVSDIDLSLLVALLFGGVIGVRYGARLHDFLSASVLTRATAGLVGLIGLRLLF